MEENYCCSNCFQDNWLKKYISENGQIIPKCQFCEAVDTRAIPLEKLEEIISPLIQVYSPITEFYPLAYLKEHDSSDCMIWERLTNDWSIFDDSLIGEEILNSIFLNDSRDLIGFMNDPVDIEDDWYGEELKPNYKIWEKFCHEIRHENRFDPKSFNKEIIDEIISVNEKELNVDSILYRARIQNHNEVFQKNDLGAPPPKKAIYGRMNPQGISYLYLSDSPKTCINEVRPKISSTVIVGTFKVIKSCKLVELTSESIGSPFKWGEKFPSIYKYKGFLMQFIQDVSKPTNQNSSYLDYLPTQFVSEYIKNKGYDGIKFKSSLGEGYNIVLFNRNLAEFIEVTSISEIKIKDNFELD